MAPIIKERKLLLGAILIITGILLFLRNADILFFPFPHWVFSWPALLLVVGLVVFLSSDNPTGGIILMALGGFFLLSRIFAPFLHFPLSFWPLLIIVAGVLLILRRRGPAGRPKEGSEEALSGEYIDDVAIFGGAEKQITSKNLKGGRLTAIFGGGQIDLTHAKLAEGVSEMDLFAMFGGWEITVPAHWNVEIKVIPFLGGFSDKRRVYEPEDIDESRKLVLKGLVIFGGGEIKSFKTK